MQECSILLDIRIQNKIHMTAKTSSNCFVIYGGLYIRGVVDFLDLIWTL